MVNLLLPPKGGTDRYCRYGLLMLLLLSTFASFAQPAGYTPGTQVCWTYNGREHQYFRSVGWDSSRDYTIIVWGGNGQLDCASMIGQIPANLFTSPNNWNGVTTLSNGATRKWQVLALRGQTNDYFLPNYNNDITYFFQHVNNDTSKHYLHHMAAFSGGTGRALGWLMDHLYGLNSPYRHIFSTGIWMSPTYLSMDFNLANVPTTRNYVWYGTADANAGTPRAAAFELYNRFSNSGGRQKFIDSTVGGTHSNNTWGDCLKLTGTNNRWTWMIGTDTTCIGCNPPNPPVAGPFHKLTLDKARMVPLTPFRKAEQIIDGNINTAICDNFELGDFAIPQQFIYILGDNGKDSAYTSMRIRFYNGGFAAGVKFTLSLISDNFGDTVNLLDSTPYLNWKYMDSGVTAHVPFPVRYLKFTVNGCASAFGEIEVYGSAVTPVQPFFKPQNFTQASPKFTSYFGANVNGDEPDSLWNAFHTVRLNNATWYFDTATVGVTPSTHKYLFTRWGDQLSNWSTKKTQFGFNREMWFYTTAPSAANMPVPRPYNPSSPDQYNYYAAYNAWKDIVISSDSTNPASWINQARLGYATAALFGKNAAASLTGYNITASNTTPGQDLLRGIEFGNESNATWMGHVGYSSPLVKAAHMSAAYDGHLGTMGPRVGVKAADSTFKVYSGALIGIDSSYLKAFCFYLRKIRGLNAKVPLDVLCVNAYCTDAGQQHAGTQGVTPAQFRLYEKMTQFIDIVHRFLGNVEVRWTEFGWDSNPNSIYSAKAHGSKDAQEVKADRIIQAYHMGRLAHLHGADQYRTRDEGDQNNTVGFITSGQFSGWPTFIRWKTSYWMSTTLNVLKNYNAWPTLINNGDSTGLWVLRDDPVNGNDTTVFTLFRGTNDGSTQSYNLAVGAGALYAERVDMQNGNKTGVVTPLVISGGTIALSNLGETTVYVRVVYGSQMLMSVSDKVNVYPNPSGGQITIDVSRMRETVQPAAASARTVLSRTTFDPVLVKEVKVYNTTGALVKAFRYGTGKSNTVTFHIGNQPAGSYHIVMVTSVGTVTKKIELMK